MGLVLVWALAGCGGPPAVRYDYPAVLRYRAAVDSVGLTVFRNLPLPERRSRQRLAAAWLRRAAAARSVVGRLAALRNAAGLAPDNAETWVELARWSRWAGSDEGTLAYLAAARAALAAAPAGHRSRLARRITLMQAWLHYDRGEWLRGLAGTDSLLAANPQDRETLLVHGLLLAGAQRRQDATFLAQQIERQDFFRTDWRWIRAVSAVFQGDLKEAKYLFGFTPNPLHRTECWNDRGALSERLGDWNDARRNYRRARESLPVPETTFLVRYDRIPRGFRTGGSALPVWLAFDRFFSVGSRLAYADLARQKFETAVDPAAREFWAGATLAATSICIRRAIGRPWARAWRGLVYAQLELWDLAETDLQRALTAFQRRGLQDAPTLVWLGRVKLQKKRDYPAAVGLLRRAVAIDSTQAVGWSYLGYGLILTGDPVAGRVALDRAISLDPTLTAAWYNRGLANFHAGRWSEAVRDLAEAARLAPDNREIAAILQRAELMKQRAGPDGQQPQDPTPAPR